MYIGKRATLATLNRYSSVTQRSYYYNTANQAYRASCILSKAGYRHVTTLCVRRWPDSRLGYTLICQDAEGNSYHIGEPLKGA